MMCIYKILLKILKNFTEKSNYLISFYAIGEFSKDIKNEYIHNVISKVEHGFILWNPNPNSNGDSEGEELIRSYHSNLSIEDETPSTGTNNLQITY